MAVKKKTDTSSKGKVCLQCKKKVKLTDFYNNAKNYEWRLKDKWCKECVNKFVVDLDTLQLYCRFNNRVFSKTLYEKCTEEIDTNLQTDDSYKRLANYDKKIKYRTNKIIKSYFKKMNLPNYYKFQNNDYDTAKEIADKEEELHKATLEKHNAFLEENETKSFDENWYGEYSQKELKYLNDFYEQLLTQFEISDIQMENTVKEVAKASLEMKQAYNEMRLGTPAASVRYQNARDSYLKLSDNAKLSASKRSTNDRIGFSDLGSLIKRIENSGALMRKIEFEKDEVERIRDDFRHILASFEGEDLSRKGK